MDVIQTKVRRTIRWRGKRLTVMHYRISYVVYPRAAEGYWFTAPQTARAWG